jgi:HEAT repeat protein
MDLSTIYQLYRRFRAVVADPDAASDILDQLRQPEIVQMLATQLGERYHPRMRETAVEILAHIGTEGALTLIETALDDNNNRVRIEAVKYIQFCNRRSAIPKLIGMLLGDRNSYVRKHVAIAFGNFAIMTKQKFNDAAVIHALLEALEVDENSYVRYEAALALGKIVNPIAAYGLGKALVEDENSYVRWACAKTLEEIGTQDSLPALFMGLMSINPYVKRAVFKALSQQPDATMQHLKRSMYHEKPWVRIIALAALMELSEPYFLSDHWTVTPALWN